MPPCVPPFLPPCLPPCLPPADDGLRDLIGDAGERPDHRGDGRFAARVRPAAAHLPAAQRAAARTVRRAHERHSTPHTTVPHTAAPHTTAPHISRAAAVPGTGTACARSAAAASHVRRRVMTRRRLSRAGMRLCYRASSSPRRATASSGSCSSGCSQGCASSTALSREPPPAQPALAARPPQPHSATASPLHCHAHPWLTRAGVLLRSGPRRQRRPRPRLAHRRRREQRARPPAPCACQPGP